MKDGSPFVGVGIAARIQCRTCTNTEDDGTKQRTTAIGTCSTPSRRARMFRGDPAQRDTAGKSHDNAVLAGKCRQNEKQECKHDERDAHADRAPKSRSVREAHKACDSGVGKQHVLPDDSLVDEKLRRQHTKGRQHSRGPGYPRAEPQKRQKRAKRQHNIEKHEQSRAGQKCVTQPQEPGHHRRVPGSINPGPAL